jgi:hypothetical protein
MRIHITACATSGRDDKASTYLLWKQLLLKERIEKSGATCLHYEQVTVFDRIYSENFNKYSKPDFSVFLYQFYINISLKKKEELKILGR